MKAARPCDDPSPRLESSRGCTSRGVGGRPGMRTASGGGAASGILSSPRANASAAANVSATFSSGASAARQACAASNNDRFIKPSARQRGRTSGRAARLLSLVGTQLADAFEIAGFDAGHVLAIEARRIEVIDALLRPRHGLLQVLEVLVDQPVATEDLLDLLFAAIVGDEFVDRRPVDAVDVRITH